MSLAVFMLHHMPGCPLHSSNLRLLTLPPLCLLRRPRPVIEEVTVKVDVPAIMMEEAAPQVLPA